MPEEPASPGVWTVSDSKLIIPLGRKVAYPLNRPLTTIIGFPRTTKLGVRNGKAHVRVADNASEATLCYLPKDALHRRRGRIVAKEGFP